MENKNSDDDDHDDDKENQQGSAKWTLKYPTCDGSKNVRVLFIYILFFFVCYLFIFYTLSIFF